MATLDSLTDDVIEITKRPDQITYIRNRIKVATLKAHHKEWYIRDMIKDWMFPASPATSFVLDVSSKFPLFRKMDSIYPVLNGQLLDKLSPIQPDDLFSEFGNLRNNCWYQTGTDVNIRTVNKYDQFLVHVYVHPNVSDSGYSSWIANEYPDAIVCRVAGDVFARAGKDAEATQQKNAARETDMEIIREQLVAGLT